MKRILTLLASLTILATITASAQFNLGNLGALLGGGASETADSTATDSTSRGGGLGDLLKGAAGALGLTSTDATIANLTGDWSYSGPAVIFKSDNLLLKAGGEAASATVEKKLENYYKMAGFQSLSLTIAEDSTFTLKVKAITLKGTLSRDDESGNYTFNFQALKKINLGHITAYINLKGKNTMDLTFDVSKLLTIIEKVGSITGNSTIKGMTSLLEKYDGLTAGFELKKQ